MVSIIKAIGKNYENVLLKDNESTTGGKSHSEETLGEFMAECEISPNSDYGELCITLEKNGLCAVRPIAHIDQSGREEAGYTIYNLLRDW